MTDERILVLIEPDAFWARTVLRGINEVALERGWALLIHSPQRDLRRLLRSWQPSAVVTTVPLAATPRDELATRVVVGVNVDLSADGLPWVYVDNRAVGELAAAHLLSKGLEHFATFSFESDGWALHRVQAFRARIAAAGRHCHADGWLDSAENGFPPASLEWVPAWLDQLPKPCGIFACCDTWARVVSCYCRANRHRVPDDVALIGADDDPLECELTIPARSSVAIPWREIGREAARRVDGGLRGSLPVEGLSVAPVHVVARRSTENFAVDDPLVSSAITWIHDHSHRPLAVGDVARAMKTYRQRLERRFRAVLDRSVMEEVRRSRVERAKHLLAMTDLPLPEVAGRSGFTSAALLHVAFQREVRTTPGAYRRRARLKASAD